MLRLPSNLLIPTNPGTVQGEQNHTSPNEGPGREKQGQGHLNLPDPCNLIELLGGLPEIIYVPVFYKSVTLLTV